MKFPFLIKKKRIFVWYSGHWINIPLEVACHGGGIKGTYSFLKGLIQCMLGKHSYSNIFCLKQWQSKRECHFCRKKE